ncbi:MAG TPA: deoxyguanosinetriphosphate triphosphohydrolase [Chloroflexota bacterium]|nr:deoxyguanosinetriphosphate triphosphohydrolase [Chloroflexota bacterium]
MVVSGSGMELEGVRRELEQLEHERLAPWAARSDAGRGRARLEPLSPVRTEYQRDRDRIIHCNAFRRLKHKTQVFIAPRGEHYATRLTHVLEVAQVARTIARALRLNEDLVEAIALAHDLGHAPFGHAGQSALNEHHPRGFAHDKQSLRVVEKLERDGQGLNLTWEVREGIRTHRKPRFSIAGVSEDPSTTLEAEVVKLADGIAYINHDIDDAVRAEVISLEQVAGDRARVLGRGRSERINAIVCDIIRTSRGRPAVEMSPPILEAVDALRDFLFENVYLSPVVRAEYSRAHRVVSELYLHFCMHPEEMPETYVREASALSVEQSVCDFIAGMTDQYALNTFEVTFVPKMWSF